MRHSEPVETDVLDRLRRGCTVPEVAQSTGLPPRTIRDMADRAGIDPASARSLPTQVAGESLLTEMVAIAADARGLLENLSKKIRSGPADHAPKYATAYAKILDSVAKLGIAKVAYDADEEQIEEENLETASGEPEITFGIERGDDDSAGDFPDEEELEAPDADESTRERLLRTHAQRAFESDDPEERVRRMGIAVGQDPPPTPGEIHRMRILGPPVEEEEAAISGTPT